MVAVFDVAPATNYYNLEAQQSVLYIFLLFAGFGFLLTFIREIIKDVEDIEGDKTIEAKSIPISFGIVATKRIVLSISILLIVMISAVAYSVMGNNQNISIYLTALVAAPMFYFIFRLIQAKNKEDYHKLSGMLKLIMLLGILSIFFI